MRVAVISTALLALGTLTASAGQCSDEIGDIMLSVRKQRTPSPTNFTVASAPDPQKFAKIDELIGRAKNADRDGREDECLQIVKRIAGN